MTEDPRRDRLRRRRVRVAGQPVRPRRNGPAPDPAAEFTWIGQPPAEPDALTSPAAPVEAGPAAEDRPAAAVALEDRDEAEPVAALAEPPSPESAPEPLGTQSAAPAPVAEPAPPAEPDTSVQPARAASPFRRFALPVGLGAAAVALAVVVAILAGQVSTARSAQSARLPALAAAESAAAALLSVNYTHLSQDVTRADSYLTPGFRKSYNQFRANFAPTYQKYQTVIIASVTGGGLRDVTATSATALLFVDQITTGTNRTAPRIDQDRVRVTLVLRQGRWEVAGLAAL